jgi:hypothetical protein
MKNVLYKGDIQTMNITVGDAHYGPWSRGEVKDIVDAHAVILLKNPVFVLAGEQGVSKVEKVTSKIDMDLNKDGVVDSKDATLAAKVLGSVKRVK